MQANILNALLIIAFLGVGVPGRPSVSAQDSSEAERILQKAVLLEDVDGDLQAAIEQYKTIVAEYPDNRPVASKALVGMGRCYEKLGKDEAAKAYERVVSEYADQNEAASHARARLAVLRKSARPATEAAFATRQVWTGPDMDFEGAPSPDGRYLSFVDWTTGDLAIRDLETGTNRRLTDKGPWEKSDEFAEFSRWSPDGKQIAYDWYDGKCCIGLRVISAEGGRPRSLVNCEEGEWMETYDWSPDGRQILILLEQKDDTYQIVMVSAADGTTTVVKSFERRGGYPHAMRFSRDGGYIAYDQTQQENALDSDIFLISADGSREMTLVEHPAQDFLLGWSPDGRGVVFASDRTGSLDMWYLPVHAGKAQGAPELVKSGVEEIVPMGFTQNGSFYYAQAPFVLDVYVARIDSQNGKILAPPEKAIRRFEGRNSWPDYSADGKYLAYVSTRNRSFHSALYPNILCIRSLDTGEEQEFATRFRRLAGPRWSPDGQLLYLAAWDNEGMGIYRVNTQNGEFTPIVRVKAPASLHWHEISPDGSTFIYGRRENSKAPYRIVSRKLTTGEEKVLHTGDKNWFSISPDGKRLALINQGKDKVLQITPVSGGRPTELMHFKDEKTSISPVEWSADGKYIFFDRMHKNNLRGLWRIAVNGGKPEALNLEMSSFQNLSVHPEGRHIAFDSPGAIRSRPAIWVMENFLPSGEEVTGSSTEGPK